MSSKPDVKKAPSDKPGPDRKPVWADGLKRMYDSVVQEDIPDDIVALLKKLDQAVDKD